HPRRDRGPRRGRAEARAARDRGGRPAGAGGLGRRDRGGAVRIAWEARGSGEPLLLIQGLGYARWGWEPVVEPLARRFRVLVFDNRGIGESDAPPGPYSAAAMAGDALQVLDEAGADSAHVVGASLGGMIAQELALAAPERVRRLVLACTAAGGSSEAPMPAETVELLARAPSLPPERSLRLLVERARGDGHGRRRARRARRADH